MTIFSHTGGGGKGGVKWGAALQQLAPNYALIASVTDSGFHELVALGVVLVHARAH